MHSFDQVCYSPGLLYVRSMKVIAVSTLDIPQDLSIFFRFLHLRELNLHFLQWSTKLPGVFFWVPVLSCLHCLGWEDVNPEHRDTGSVAVMWAEVCMHSLFSVCRRLRVDLFYFTTLHVSFLYSTIKKEPVPANSLWQQNFCLQSSMEVKENK